MDGIYPGDIEELIRLEEQAQQEKQRQREEQRQKYAQEYKTNTNTRKQKLDGMVLNASGSFCSEEVEKAYTCPGLWKSLQYFLEYAQEHPFQRWHTKPGQQYTVRDLVEAWDYTGTRYLYDTFLKPLAEQDERQTHADSLDSFNNSFFSIYNPEILEFILLNLPVILEANYRDIQQTGMITMVDPEDVFSRIENLYKEKQKEGIPWSKENIERGKDNIRRVPVKCLNKENIFSLPSQNFDFFKKVFAEVSLYPAEFGIRANTFNRMILRHAEEDHVHLKEVYEELLTDATKIKNSSARNNLEAILYDSCSSPVRVKRLSRIYGMIKVSFPERKEKLLAAGLPKKEGSWPLEMQRVDDLLSAVEKSSSRIVDYTLRVQKVIQSPFPRQGEYVTGFSSKVQLSLDALCSLFGAWQSINSNDMSKETRNKINRLYYEDWKEHKGNNPNNGLEPVIVETLSALSVKKFLHDENKSISETKKDPATIIKLLEVLRNPLYFNGIDFSDEYINAINRLKIRCEWCFELKYDFDEIKIEANQFSLDELINLANDCVSVGGKYEQYGFRHAVDAETGILTLNVYKEKKYVDTIGKAFLIHCQEQEEKILYVDGVVMMQDIADALQPRESTESEWLPLYTKAILQTAQIKGFQNLVFNVSHTSTQRSVWQYCKHLADLLGLKEGRDYTYRENPRQVMTTSEEGFQLTDESARRNLHYLEKIVDENYSQEHFLAGFWINHWDSAQDSNNPSKTYSSIPEFVPRQHRDRPYINDGKGQIIGLKVSTEELSRLFKEKYPQ